jgi:hypothetical protein
MFHPSAFCFSLQLQLSAFLPAPFRLSLQLADSAFSLQLQQAGETTNLVRLQIDLTMFHSVHTNFCCASASLWPVVQAETVLW